MCGGERGNDEVGEEPSLWNARMQHRRAPGALTCRFVLLGTAARREERQQ